MVGEIKLLGEWGFDRWIGIIGIVLGLASFIVGVLVKEVRESVRSIIHASWRQTVFLLLGGSIFGYAYWRGGVSWLVAAIGSFCLVFALWVAGRFRGWRPYQRYDRGRWEKTGIIRYGHLEYEPFLYYKDGNPTGVGVKLLEQLLKIPLEKDSVDIKPFRLRRNWSDVIKGLRNSEYAVVATPLFATFDRSKYVAFSAPLCFSNVGLYVSEEMSHRSGWNRNSMIVDTMQSTIEQASGLNFLSVEGEISEKLARKYRGKCSIKKNKSGFVGNSLFEEIASSRSPEYALFCESFYAEEQEEVKLKKVVNVLRLHEILYPVCFAVRLGDYQLINLLNIRLLQFNQNGGALPLLAEEWRKSRGEKADLAAIKEHFVAEWPGSVQKEPGGAAHA